MGKAPSKTLFKTDQLVNLNFFHISINGHRKRAFLFVKGCTACKQMCYIFCTWFYESVKVVPHQTDIECPASLYSEFTTRCKIYIHIFISSCFSTFATTFTFLHTSLCNLRRWSYTFWY